MIKIEIEKGEKKYINQDGVDKIVKMEKPDFESHQLNLTAIREMAEKYRKFKNVILIGNGGSRTSAWAFYNSLFEFRNEVKFEFLSSAEPELITSLRKKYSKEDTLILAISKSGANVNSLEPLLLLSDYPVLAVTGESGSKLRQMAEIQGWDTLVHPEVGGRYSGLTSSGLTPAALMGLPVEELCAGAKKGYQKYGSKNSEEENDALRLAGYFYELEERGYTEIFASIYSSSLFAFLPLLVQLVHESTGKDGKGQTIFGDYSPESQHHTNQRFFGGRKNVAGLFMGVEKSQKDVTIQVPESLSAVSFGDANLSVFSGLSGSETMHFDLAGVLENAKRKKIPAATLWVSEITPESVGELMVFFHYFTVYCALLRDQNPYDQPEVEDSKKISWELRKSRK